MQGIERLTQMSRDPNEIDYPARQRRSSGANVARLT